ncbi:MULTISPECIES: hypothetical protein [Nocardia]|uniref:hypothetical protein n=1 Tax=Nocardia TaxID=1817 RepID=UPI00135C429F|nr:MULTISPECIES: hypothetical protein [Nocardia]
MGQSSALRRGTRDPISGAAHYRCLAPRHDHAPQGSPTTDASLVHIWSLTGTVEDDAGNAAGFAEFSPRDVITTAGSPILDIAGPMMAGIDRATAAAMIA